MRYSVIKITDDSYVEYWKMKPEYLGKTKRINATRKDYIYSGENILSRFDERGYKLLKELDGLQYYYYEEKNDSENNSQQNDPYEQYYGEPEKSYLILVPESHPLFNFHIIANQLHYERFDTMPRIFIQLVRTFNQKYITPVVGAPPAWEKSRESFSDHWKKTRLNK